ncbi:MAG TPA: MBL fold metallo-hydrolase [Gemmataceae bacterium]|nr:MBL fold metallo-hydrolase [Gemmataceae bacterium]
MPNFICVTCGTRFAATPVPPERCPICEDPRQYVGVHGQQWTTMDELAAGHRNVFRPQEPGLVGVGTEPHFAIGQRALLLRTPGGNVLWDCVSLIDELTRRAVVDQGGLRAIAISHPHYYSAMVAWSHTFGGVPVYLHAADRQWVMDPDPVVRFWEGETLDLGDGLTLIRCGGHFEGGTVLHWPSGAGGRGALLSGDILQVCADRRHVSFMWSYPNYIPLSAPAVRQVVAAVAPFAYDRVYGAWWDKVIADGGREAVAHSMERYLRAIGAA